MNVYLLTALVLSSILFTRDVFGESPWEIQPKEMRERMNAKAFAIPAETPDVWDVKDITITSNSRKTPLRIYLPSSDKDLPVILLIHGGAWVAGSLDTHDNLARYLCRGAAAVVVSVGYLNAPEGKFPYSLEQCYDALLWVNTHAKEFSGDPQKGLAVVGDSAGGNMAAAVCLLARDRKGPVIDVQVLINPVINNTGGGTLERQNDALDMERWYITQYITDPKEARHPLVSLNFAKDLSHLPPALVLLAEKDLFLADAKEYAEKLSAAGVPTNIYMQWGTGHLAANGGRASKLAQESLDVAVAALRGAFYRKAELAK